VCRNLLPSLICGNRNNLVPYFRPIAAHSNPVSAFPLLSAVARCAVQFAKSGVTAVAQLDLGQDRHDCDASKPAIDNYVIEIRVVTTCLRGWARPKYPRNAAIDQLRFRRPSSVQLQTIGSDAFGKTY